MNDNKIQGYNEALKLSQKYTSLRAKKLQHLEKYVEGTQYDGLPDWFSEKAPLWERAPCIVYPIVKAAIDSNMDLLLGDGRFPTFEFDGLIDDDTTTTADASSTATPKTETAEKCIEHIIRQSRFKAAAREVFAAGQGCGSACAVFGYRGKRLFIDTLKASWCVPTFDIDGAVTAVDVEYPYLQLVKDSGNGEERWVCCLYKRRIDDKEDVTFLPAKARDDGTQPKWTRDKERTFLHGLGFCPVVWFAHLKGCSAVNDYDGKALHEHLTDEIRALDFSLSQKHRAALYAGDPQWTEIGVEPGFNPTGRGRKADMPASLQGLPGEARTGSYVGVADNGSGGSRARRKSPGTIWQYPGKAIETKVELHSLPADALGAIDAHAKDLKSKISEGLGVVFMDLESVPEESRLSGKALESFKSRQLDKINYYRSDFGDRFVIPAISMLLRIVIECKVPIKGIDVIETAVLDKTWSWVAPPMELIWGDYFEPSGEEENYLIMASAAALNAGFMTRRATVEQRKNILKIRDVDAFMKELDAEREENNKTQVDMAVAAKPPEAGEAKPAAKGNEK